MHALTAIVDLSKLLGKLPYVGEVIAVVSVAAGGVLPSAQTLCSALGDFEAIVKDPAEAAGEIVDGVDAIKERLQVVSDYCGTASTLVDRAELVGSQLCAQPLDAGCGAAVAAMVAGEALVADTAQKISSIIAAAPHVAQIASTLSSIFEKADALHGPLQDIVSLLNTLTPYLN
eukprot:Opistho-2@57768